MAQPGVSPQLAAEIRAIGDPAQHAADPGDQRGDDLADHLHRRRAGRGDGRLDGPGLGGDLGEGRRRLRCRRPSSPERGARHCPFPPLRSPRHRDRRAPPPAPTRPGDPRGRADQALRPHRGARRAQHVGAARARSSGSSGPTAPARPPPSSCCSGWPRRPPARRGCSASRSATPQARRRVGYLPELFRYPAWLSPVEVLRFHCRLIGIPRARARRARSRRCSTTVGLRDRARDRVGTFSKGMQQRLGLAVAMLGAPEIVFLDEPDLGARPGRPPRRARRHPRAARQGHRRLPQLPPAQRGGAGVRPRRRGRPRPGHRVGHARRAPRRRRGGAPARHRRRRPAPPCWRAGARWPPTASGSASPGVDGEAIADIVAALVARGGRVHAVEPQRLSLEDRFLEVLRAADDGAAA